MAFPLYFDDDVESRALAAALRSLGFDVERASDVGMRGRPDPEHLEHASEHGRAVFTANRGDFRRIHHQWTDEGRHHAGIIILTQQRYSVGEQIRRFAVLLSELSPEEMRDSVQYLSDWG